MTNTPAPITPNRNGCHGSCTTGWIRSHGQWVKCPNHLNHGWEIGPPPPPVKTDRARQIIAETKAYARRVADDADDADP